MKKLNDINNLSNIITYHRYMFSKDQADILFKNIAPSEYIALKEISDLLDDGKVYLQDIAKNMKISITKASKIASSLKEKGLVVWSHDGDGSEGTYVSFTESGRKIMDEQEKILKEYYGEVAKKFGEERLISLLSLMSELEDIMSDELKKIGGGEDE
ncbi:MAG: MarR family winged helix-turn-helix transcriptional regulator [Bacilli bacterium]